MRDAKEQAPEFAREPTTTETRLEPELIITKQPVWELLHRGDWLTESPETGFQPRCIYTHGPHKDRRDLGLEREEDRRQDM